VQNDKNISAIYDQERQLAMVVFWGNNGGSATYHGDRAHAMPPFTITSNANTAIIYNPKESIITVSDPSQSLASVAIQIEAGFGHRMPHWAKSERGKVIIIDLPQGGQAGNSVTRVLRSHKRRFV
jgi:hypothetical protein